MGRLLSATAGPRRCSCRGAGAAARPRLLGGLLGVEGGVEAVVDGEQPVELRDRQQLADAVRRVDEDELAVAVAEAAEVTDQLADARRVDVVDAREVDEDVP